MLENRPLLVIAIAYIIGVIMGLYFKFSIALLYVILGIIYLILKQLSLKNKINSDITLHINSEKYDLKFMHLEKKSLNKKMSNKLKLFSRKRYLRYIKIILTKKVFTIFIITSIISNAITLYQNNKYETLYQNFEKQEVTIEGIVMSNDIEKEYKDSYKIKVINMNNSTKFKNTYVFLNIKKQEYKLQYGDKILINGTFELPATKTNYKGFDYRQYLKSEKIYGIVDASKISNFSNLDNNDKIIDNTNNENNNMNKINAKEKNLVMKLLEFSNNIFIELKEVVQENFEKDIADVILGLTLGYNDEMKDDIKQSFRESNSSHILAVSGMHVSIITIFLKLITEKTFGKKVGKILISAILFIYMFITGLSPSIVRACITSIIAIISFFFYRKSDFLESISISILILLVHNPFLIQNVSLLLSYTATISIIVLNENINRVLNIMRSKMYITFCNKFYKNNYKRFYKKMKLNQNKNYSTISLALSATIGIIPILSASFNQIPLTSLFVGIIIGLIATPIILISIIFIVFTILINEVNLHFFKIFIDLKQIIVNILSFFVKVILQISGIAENIPLNKMYVKTPNMFEIFIYYSILLIINFLISIYTKRKLNQTQKRMKNLISLFKYKFNQNKKKIISNILIIVILICFVKILPHNLEIYFIDVGQGDSTLIVTPNDKTILIDGGGSEFSDFDVGENTVIPYLLDRRIKKLDYVFITHFDTDHVRTDC